MESERMGVSKILLNGVDLQECTEINVEGYSVDNNFLYEEASSIDNCFECEIECDMSEKDMKKLYSFFYGLAIRAWKRLLAWITFCIEYFRRN